MGLGTLTDRSSGQTILDTFFNDIHSAIDGDFVGRNTSGVATSGQNLGTAAIPWGTLRAASLVLGGASVDTSQLTSAQNRVTSGKTRTTSNQPAFITPNGAAASFLLAGATTNLVFDVNGTAVSVTTDITKSSLTVGPSATHTCLVNDSLAAGQADTRLWGEPEHRRGLTVDTMGVTVSALIGKFAAFKTGTEYFLAYVESATSLTRVRRGYFYSSALAPLNRALLTDNDVITLMSLGWVFVENNATTIDVTYTNPNWSFTSPTSPATGDYWYDLANKTWKRYDGASFQIINRTLVGMVVIDATNCVAARCEDFYGKYSADNTVDVDLATSAIIRSTSINQKVNVMGTDINFSKCLPVWNITTDLATSADMYNATEQASTMYYLYVKDTGAFVISDISPYFRNDLMGRYHPHNPWRCVAMAYNDGSSNFLGAHGFVRGKSIPMKLEIQTGNGNGSTNTKIRRFTTVQRQLGAAGIYVDSSTLGMSVTIYEPGVYGIGYGDSHSVAAGTGLSRNTTQPTTNIQNITADDCLLIGGINGVNNVISVQPSLKIGDVVRCHASTSLDGTGTNDTKLIMTQLEGPAY